MRGWGSDKGGEASLHVPDLAEQRGELVLAGAPGEQHLGVVVVERAQLRQAAQQPGEVLGLGGVPQPAELAQDLQHRLLQPLHRRLVPHVRPVCGGGHGYTTVRITGSLAPLKRIRASLKASQDTFGVSSKDCPLLVRIRGS